MAEQSYYKAVGGITDGMSFYANGEVFAGTPTLDANFEATGGKDGDKVLYEKATAKEYADFRASVAAPVANGAPGSPTDVVGFAPTGEDALAPSQVDASGAPLKADLSAPKNDDTETIPVDSPEAERRLNLDAEQPSAKAAPSKKASSE